MRLPLLLSFFCLSICCRAADNATAWLNYGNGLYQKSQYAAALKAYDTALASDPQNAILYQAKGSALYQLGRKDEALHSFQRSLELNPNNTALATYVNSLKPSPNAGPGADQATTRVSALSNTTSALSNSTPAPSDTPSALINDDDLEDAKNLIAEHKLSEADARLTSILKASPDSSSAHAMRGDVYYSLGRMADARKEYQRSLALDAEQPRVQQVLEAHLPEGIENTSTGLGTGVGASAWSPLWRSAVFPGWGQVYNGQSNKGIVLGGATLIFLGGTIASYLGADNAFKDYSALGPGTGEADFNAAYDKLQSYATANHIFAVLFYSAYIYTLGDAAANAKPAVTVGLRQDAQGTMFSSLNWNY